MATRWIWNLLYQSWMIFGNFAIEIFGSHCHLFWNFCNVSWACNLRTDVANFAILGIYFGSVFVILDGFGKCCNSYNAFSVSNFLKSLQMFLLGVCNLGQQPLPFVWECPAIESQSVWRMCNIYRVYTLSIHFNRKYTARSTCEATWYTIK